MESKEIFNKSTPSGIHLPGETAQHHKHRHPAMVRLKNRFLAGLLVLVPVMVAIWALRVMLDLASRYFGPSVSRLLRHYVPEGSFILNLTGPIVTVVSVLLALLVVLAVGYLTTFLAVRKLIHIGESIVQRIPVVKFFYNTPKEVMTTLMAPTTTKEKRVVFVQFPRAGAWSLAFATDEIRDTCGMAKLVAVFMPTAPNPTTGFLVYMDPEEVRECALTVEQAARLILSGGILSPDSIPTRPYMGMAVPPMTPIEAEGLVKPEQARAIVK